MSFGVVRPSFTVSRRFLPYSKALLAHVQMTSSTPSSSSSSSRLPYSSKAPAAAGQGKSDSLAEERAASSDTVPDRK
ncbi:unnamed protein product, partial [Anisakis simplex]|uniref:ATP synthase subunit epsilon, mitochondrial n=1 Tax=Anisakis simplex TaxID=6269 RepID=A0A0M3KJE8_ANISI